MGIFSRFKGLLPVGWCWVSARAFKSLYGAFMGLYGLVIISARVPRLPARKKGPFLPPVCLPACLHSSLSLQGLPCLSVLVSVSIYEKRNGLLLGRFLCGCCGVWFLLLSANIEDCKRVAVSACYCYLVFVCLQSSCRGACNVV